MRTERLKVLILISDRFLLLLRLEQVSELLRVKYFLMSGCEPLARTCQTRWRSHCSFSSVTRKSGEFVVSGAVSDYTGEEWRGGKK